MLNEEKREVFSNRKPHKSAFLSFPQHPCSLALETSQPPAMVMETSGVILEVVFIGLLPLVPSFASQEWMVTMITPDPPSHLLGRFHSVGLGGAWSQAFLHNGPRGFGELR